MPHRTTHITQIYDPTATNACGRLLRVDDGTGYQTFAYDRLGNVAENIRAIALPFEDSVYNFRMMFEYDSWNRVQRIVYPDSEVVTYNYDLTGNLNRVHTYKAGHRDTLIKNILYDEFGHRTQVNFGNGVTTNYTYDILQRLNTLQTYSNNASLQKISYSFDLEDNITRVANSTAPVNGLGGGYTFDYQYDNLYRLTSSTGSFTPTNASYYLEMDFTPAGRVCRKEQGDNNGSKRLLYGYNPTNAPHAARRIYDPTTTNLRQIIWDANGNIAQIAEYLYDANNQQTFLQDFRNHYWDEDDRLNMVLDNSHFSYYLYGNDGQRVAKLTGSAFTLGTGFATNAMLDNYTLYPSEYLVVTQQGYTKYYYANGTRIASRLGSGGFEKMTRLCTLDQNLTYNANTLFNSVVARVGEDMPQEYVSDPCPAYNNDMAGFRVPLQPLNFEPNFGITAQQNVLQAFRQNYANEETYYFHGNHLGSANWITTANAAPTQFLLHLPYGEEFVKQLSGSYDERFTFTGKEKDIETGYYYFGARFDNVDLGFMSVDPMSDKYPSISPYAYCAWNPVKLVDPEGSECFENDDGWLIDHKNKTVTKISDIGGNQRQYTTSTDNFSFSYDVSIEDFTKKCQNEGYEIKIPSSEIIDFSVTAASSVFSAFNNFADESQNFFQGLQNESNSLKWGLDYSSEINKFNKIGKYANRIGKGFGIIGIGLSVNQLRQDSNIEDGIYHSMDIIMGGIGMCKHPVAIGISLGWSLFGRQIIKRQAETIQMQIDMGLNPGHCSLAPFK